MFSLSGDTHRSDGLHSIERAFDTIVMLSAADLMSIRRSAAMAALSAEETCRVLDTCDQLLRERARIVELLADLPASWTNVRNVLNELQAIVR